LPLVFRLLRVFTIESQLLQARVFSRSEHSVSRAGISEAALKVLYKLKDAGFRACLVGGGVRDLLLGREPKDFDVATDAHPEQIRELFRSARIIGRRFRLVHVRFGREVIEVATFRAPHETDNGMVAEDGRILRDNEYGSIETDAMRRDFTVNALYYDISNFSVIDYANGVEDLRAGRLRLIGDPEVRFREDPVRMLRAVRFSAKLGFRIDDEVEEAIYRLGSLLEGISPARMFDETLKLFHGGSALQTFEALRHYDLYRYLFPMTDEVLAHEEQGFPDMFVANALKNTDERINEGKPVTPAFLFAVMLWEPVRHRLQDIMAEEDIPEAQALQIASSQVLSEQARSIGIPRRFSLPMRDIWHIQPRFHFRRGKRPLKLLTHPKFRAAYDFLCLRAHSGEDLQEECEWWTEFQTKGEAEQKQSVAVKKKRSRRRPRNRKSHD
jgi:poly(A) polymerase